MKKLLYCGILLALFTFQSTIRAFDESSLAVPLVVATGALVVSGCYMYKQHTRIRDLEKQLQNAATIAPINNKEELATLQQEIAKLTEQNKVAAQEFQEKLAAKQKAMTAYIKLKEQLDKLTEENQSKTQELEKELAKKHDIIVVLTKNFVLRSTALKEWETFEQGLHTSVPFLGVKEANASKELLEKLTALKFLKSEHPHKVPGLVTYVSTSDIFSSEEKNMISDEESSLDSRDDLLNDISVTLAATKAKVGGTFGSQSSEDASE